MMSLSNGCKISSVPTELVPVAWPAVFPLLKDALEYNQGTCTAEDVYVALQESRASLWVAEHKMILMAACVAEIVGYPRGKSLRIWLLAGREMKLWKEGIAAIESFGRAYGCSFIEVLTRRGMEKLIRDLGFSTKFIWSIKPLDSRTH